MTVTLKNAADVRGPEAATKYYLEASLGSYMEPLLQTARKLGDFIVLKFIGFDTDFATVGARTVEDPMVIDQDALAQHVVDLAVELMFARVSSMAWHSDSWPGLAARFCSPSAVVRKEALRLLQADQRGFATAEGFAAGNTFLAEVVARPPSDDPGQGYGAGCCAGRRRYGGERCPP